MPVYLSVTDSNANPLTNGGNMVVVYNGSSIAGVLSNSVVIGGKAVFQGTVWSSTPSAAGFTAAMYNAASDGVWAMTNDITFSAGSDTNLNSYGSISNPIASVAVPRTQALAFPSFPSLVYSNGLTIALDATASSGLAVSYSSVSTNVSISGTNVTVLGAGTALIVANQVGNSNYQTAPPVTNALIIEKATPSFAFNGNSLGATYTGGNIAVTLSNASGVPVTVTYNGSTNPPYDAGTYTVVATVADTNNFTSYSVTNSLTIAQGSNTITFPSLSGVTYSNGLTVGLAATSSSELAVSYSSVSTNVSISGTNVTVLGAGTASIVASQTGNSNYAEATPVTNSLVVAQGGNTITFPALSSVSTTNGPVSLNATASSGLTVSYSSASTNVSISGTNVTVLGAGTASIVASQTGNSNYVAATPVTNSLVVSAAVSGVTNPVIYVSGSTGFRTVVNALLLTNYPGRLMATDRGSATDVTANRMLFTNVVMNGATVDISVAWSGSVNGVMSAASSASNAVTVRFLDRTQVASALGAGSAPLLNATNNSLMTNARSDIALSDVFQESTRFIGGAYSTLNKSQVAVVPFSLMASRGCPASNVPTAMLGQVASAGWIPLSLLTGQLSQTNQKVWLTGRDPYSGARILTMVLGKVGALTGISQFQPTNVSAGSIGRLVRYAQITNSGIVTLAANNGESSGLVLAGYFTNTMLTNLAVPAGQSRGASNYLISYSAVGEMVGLYRDGLKPLSLDGESGRWGNTNAYVTSGSNAAALDQGYTNIITGRYPLWSYEQVMWRTNSSTNVSGVVSWLTNAVTALPSTSPILAPNIRLIDMRVRRDSDSSSQALR